MPHEGDLTDRLSGKLLSSLSQLVNSSAKNKPIFISNLGYNGKRLFSTGKPLTARAGRRLDFFISFPYYDNLHEELKEGCFDTPYGRFYIQLREVYIADLNMIKAVSPKGKNFLVTFVTPNLSFKFFLISIWCHYPPSLSTVTMYPTILIYSLTSKVFREFMNIFDIEEPRVMTL